MARLRNLNASVTLLISLTLVFQSCKKKKEEEVTPDPVVTPVLKTTPPASGGFVWTENSGAQITADSAFWTTWSTGTGVRAYKGGMANFFEINWSTMNNTAAGQKTLTGLTYLKGSSTYTSGTNQTINITGDTGSKLSGNFNVAVSGGPTITSVQGSFTEIKKK